MKNKNNITELVFILDRSGSMSGLESDTIGGFNSMIEKQKKQDGGCYVSTVLFDNESEVLHDRVKLGDIPKMTDRDYTVRGCTALIDAIGGAIHHIGNIHKYARSEDVPEHTMFVITTDGQENASHRYNSEQVKKMIERQKEKYGWEFLFIGANIDAAENAEQSHRHQRHVQTGYHQQMRHAASTKGHRHRIGKRTVLAQTNAGGHSVRVAGQYRQAIQRCRANGENRFLKPIQFAGVDWRNTTISDRPRIQKHAVRRHGIGHRGTAALFANVGQPQPTGPAVSDLPHTQSVRLPIPQLRADRQITVGHAERVRRRRNGGFRSHLGDDRRYLRAGAVISGQRPTHGPLPRRKQADHQRHRQQSKQAATIAAATQSAATTTATVMFTHKQSTRPAAIAQPMTPNVRFID